MLNWSKVTNWCVAAVLLMVFPVMFPILSGNPLAYTQTSNTALVLENDTLKVEVESSSGCVTITEKITGQQWQPDPWEHAAAYS